MPLNRKRLLVTATVGLAAISIAVPSSAASQANPPHHLDRIDERARPLDGNFKEAGNSGAGGTIYIFDTGVNIKHEEFEGRAFAGPDFAESPGSSKYGSDKDCYGHGTPVAALAAGRTYGVARAAKIVSVKVAGCDGVMTNASLSQAVHWVTRNAPPRSVVNLSFASAVNLGSPVVEQDIKDSIKAGVTYVVGAGNNSSDACQASPARIDEVITVAATSDTSDARWSGSNFGLCVDLYAPGQNVTSASSLSDTGTLTASGTSFATPQVAGAVAVDMNKTLTPGAAQRRVRDRATPNVVTGEPSAKANRILRLGGVHTRMPQVKIPDPGSISMPMDISNEGDPGSAHLRVSFKIKHPSRGQLQVDLLTPNGRSFRLYSRNSSTGNDLNLIDVPVAAADVPPNGRWRLLVSDGSTGSAGEVTEWALAF